MLLNKRSQSFTGEYCVIPNYDILEMYIVQDTSLSDSPQKTKDKRKKEESKDIYVWFSINFFRSRTFS